MRLKEFFTKEEAVDLTDLLSRPATRLNGKPVLSPETEDACLERLEAMYGQQDEVDRRERAETAAIELDLAKAEATRAKAALDRAKAYDLVGRR